MAFGFFALISPDRIGFPPDAFELFLFAGTLADAMRGAERGEADCCATHFLGQLPLVELVARRIPHRFGFDPIRDVQVLCPMNRGGVGARSLNIELQVALSLNLSVKNGRF